MASKYIYLGQDWATEELNYLGTCSMKQLNSGSVYLAGPRNNDKVSWRTDLIKKIEKTGISLTYLIPETKAQLSGAHEDLSFEDSLKWQQSSIACATAILFWFPQGVCDPKSFVEFGCWCKSERVFVGGDPTEELKYLDWLMHSEQKIHAVNSLDQLTERFYHWIIS